jgi:hypothetical protein
MTTSEYLQFYPQELKFGKKELLKSQLNMLSFLKNFQNFKELRKEEFNLKIALKIKVEELKKHLNIFEKTLPKTKIKIIEEPIKEKKTNKKLSLEEEIAYIRKKLAELQE